MYNNFVILQITFLLKKKAEIEIFPISELKKILVFNYTRHYTQKQHGYYLMSSWSIRS